MPSLSSASFLTPSTAFTIMESSRDFKYVCFPFSHPSSLDLLDRLENIPPFSNDSNSDIHRQLSISTHFVCSSSHKDKILHSPNKYFISLASSFGYVFLRVVKKYWPRKTRVHLVHRYDHFNTHIQAHCSLSAQPSLPTFASAAIFLCVPTTPLPSPSMPTPKWHFRVGF